MEITVDEKVTRYEWSLFDRLERKFDPREILAPYYEAVRKEQAELAAQEAAAKVEKLNERKNSVKEDPALIAIIDQILAQEVKSVAEYRSGKEKALNAIVGKVIGQAKKAGLDADAFAINHILKGKLNVAV